MKKYVNIALTGFLTLISLNSAAVPAKPGILEMTRPDGSSVNVRLIGDEFNHQYFSPDGYLLKEQNGEFYYATVGADARPVSSGIRLENTTSPEAQAFKASQNKTAVLEKLNQGIGLRAASRRYSAPAKGPGLFHESHFPNQGIQKGLVILVEYKDVKFQVENPLDYFSRMCNEVGFSDYGGTGSARDFFLESSMGQFDCTFDVYGPITLSKNMSAYGGNNWSGDDNDPAAMVVEACDQLDDTVDFTEYDRDGDGVIDNVFIFYAGRGEASGGSSDTVWPHSWNINSGGYTRSYDGVELYRYACSNEWEGSRPDGVGTFVHEFSHVMGLPDLYATSYTGAFTPGSWSTMDYGPYNNNGCTPPLYSAFERYALSWIDPVEIDCAMSATLPAIGENVCGIIKDTENEFFLFENRQQTGWDTYIPGHGMLVWHVDYKQSVWDSNRVNNTPSHQYVDIEEADGTQSDYSRDGDAFPGASNVRSFTGDTNPAMKTWGGKKLNFPITNIKETDGIITFDVLGGRTVEAPEANEATEILPDSFTANWSEGVTDDTASYILKVYSKDEAGSAVPLEGYEALNVGKVHSYIVTPVVPETEYFYTATAVYGLQTSDASAEISVFTGRPGLERLTPVVLEAESVETDGFTARWEKLPEASGYLLSVYEHVYGAPYAFTLGFDEGADKLPEFWTATSASGYAMTSYCGEATPSLRFGRSGDHIQTAPFEDGIRKVSFWHRANGGSEGDAVEVYALSGQWAKVASFPVVTEKGGATCTVAEEDMPEGTECIRIVYARKGSSGNLAIDDIVIYHGITWEDVPVENLTDIETGDTDSYRVTGLKSSTEYVYDVRATDGELVSRRSAKASAVTKENGAISDADVSAVRVLVNGSTVTVTGAPENASVTLCDIAGRTIASAVGAEFSFSIPAKGIYIIRINSKSYKLIL